MGTPAVLADAAGWAPASRRSVVAGVGLVVAGAQLIAIQPVFVQTLVEHAGLSAPQAGYTVSLEMLGIALGTIATTVIVNRVRWRPLLVLALALVIVGNGAAVLALPDLTWLRAARFSAGLGAGVVVPLGFATLGLTVESDRNFGLAVLGVLVYAAIVTPALPTLVGAGGAAALFALLALVAAGAMIGTRYLPQGGQTTEGTLARVADPGRVWRRSGLLAMFVYFFAQGAFWSFAALAGVTAGLDPQAVANGLSVAQIAGVGGATLAAALGAKYGRTRPLALGIGASAVTAASFLSPPGAWIFAALLCIYNFAWNMTHPYLLGVMSRFDADGRHVTYAVAMQKLGLAAGPAAAALVLEHAAYRDVVTLAAIGFVISLALILGPVLRQPGRAG